MMVRGVRVSLLLGEQLAHLDLQALTESISEESQCLNLLSVLGILHHGLFLHKGVVTSREVKLHISFYTDMTQKDAEAESTTIRPQLWKPSDCINRFQPKQSLGDMISLHLNPRSSSTSTFPSTRMNNPGQRSRLNFISLNLKVCFLISIDNLDLAFLLFPKAYSPLPPFLELMKRGSGALDRPRQNPNPSLLNSWFLYEQSLNKIQFLSNFFSQTTQQSLNRVAQGNPRKRPTFLRKLYLQSHSKVICPCQNSWNSALDTLMTYSSVLAKNQQLGLADRLLSISPPPSTPPCPRTLTVSGDIMLLW